MLRCAVYASTNDKRKKSKVLNNLDNSKKDNIWNKVLKHWATYPNGFEL